MSMIALTTFFRLRDAKGVLKYRYQNGRVGEKIFFGGQDYFYLPFVYQGAAKTRTGDNLQAALVLSVNWLAQGIAREAVEGNWRIEVFNATMNPDFSAATRTLTRENWIASSMAYDNTTVEIILSSGIDAVGANAPYRRLRSQDVGALPVTGSISNR